MKRITSLFLLSVFALSLFGQKLHFTIDFKEPQTHYTEITVDISQVTQGELEVRFPTWIPGSYLIREYQRHLEDFKAVDGAGKVLAFSKSAKNRWVVQTNGSSEVQLTYRVYCNELSVRTSLVTAQHAFLNPVTIFPFVEGVFDQPVTVTINPAPFTKISSQLFAKDGERFTYTAPNFDYLYDSPIDIGNQKILSFQAANIPHHISLSGEAEYDEKQLVDGVKKVVEASTAIFPENPIDKEYTFLLRHTLSAGGGLEHLNSTALLSSRYNYTGRYTRLLGLVAHEYFHLWNVKRIRPVPFLNYNYEEETYTDLLWVAEGGTSFYSPLILYRAGILSSEEYLRSVAGGITSYLKTPGRLVQSASASSFDTWIKQYRPNENSVNTAMSYYTKGSMLFLVLNAEVLKATKGKQSADDLMRHLYTEFYKKGKGYTQQDLLDYLKRVTKRDFAPFFEKYVDGVEELDFVKAFEGMGLEVTSEEKVLSKMIAGVSLSASGRVTRVLRGSEAYRQGLNVGDEVLAINNYRLTNQLYGILKEGETLSVLVNREGTLQTLTMKYEPTKEVRYQIVVDKNATAQQKKLMTAWLEGTR